MFEKAFHKGISLKIMKNVLFKDNEKFLVFLLDWTFYKNDTSNAIFEIPTIFNKQHCLTDKVLNASEN